MNEFDDKTPNFSDLVKQATLEQQQAGEQEEMAAAVEVQEEKIEAILAQPAPPQNFNAFEPKKEVYQPVSEVGVISAATTISGTVSTKGHVRVEGKLVGDVFAYGDIKITGAVSGDIEGGNIELEGSRITGNTLGRGDVSVGRDTVIAGDVDGQLITIDGKIEGNIMAHKGAHLANTAVVKGSISAVTMSMSSGAALMGKVEIATEEK